MSALGAVMLEAESLLETANLVAALLLEDAGRKKEKRSGISQGLCLARCPNAWG